MLPCMIRPSSVLLRGHYVTWLFPSTELAVL